MSNLLNEYRKRHRSNFIWATNDGVCFFGKNHRPGAVCVVSDPARSIQDCSKCRNGKNLLVCEIYEPFIRNHSGCIYHNHITADTDLAKILANINKSYVPYFAHNQKDIEAWLWNFFLQTKPFVNGSSAWMAFLQNQKKDKESNVMKLLSQMVWCVEFCPYIYAHFYDYVYRPFLLGRTYLLYK